MMTPELSHTAAITTGWMMAQGIKDTHGMPWEQRTAKMNEIQAAKDAFVAACHAAQTLDQVPDWVRTLMQRAGALPPPTKDRR